MDTKHVNFHNMDQVSIFPQRREKQETPSLFHVPNGFAYYYVARDIC